VPHCLMRSRPPDRTRGKRQVLLGQRGPHSSRATECGTLRTDERQTSADCLVWIQHHRAIALTVQSDGPVTLSLAALGFVPRPGLEPQA
jgi:hypothetical protein